MLKSINFHIAVQTLLFVHCDDRKGKSRAVQSFLSAKCWANPSRSRPGTSLVCRRTASASTMVSLWPTLDAGECMHMAIQLQCHRLAVFWWSVISDDDDGWHISSVLSL